MYTHLTKTLALAAALWGATLASGCGDSVGTNGDVVGGACAIHQDCAPGSACLVDNDFPGGTCSVDCRSDQDCPPGSACVEKKGGVCLLTCDYPQDCRAGYTCKGEDRQGGPGAALVCIRD